MKDWGLRAARKRFIWMLPLLLRPAFCLKMRNTLEILYNYLERAVVEDLNIVKV